MPKEITHWILAERMAAKLGGTRLGDAALRAPNVLKVGAVLPDLPYYLSGADDLACRMRDTGSEFHGAHGEDTYALLRTLLAAALDPDAQGRPAVLALIAGVACHIRADIAFHPLVYYMTGNYYDPDPARRARAIRDHRRFEGVLDLRVCGGLARVRAWSARGIWQRLECPPAALFRWAARDARHPDLQRGLERSVSKFLSAQGLFIHPAAAWLAGALAPWLPAERQEAAALFYTPDLPRSLERLSGTLNYRNPVTGEAHAATVDALLDRAVDEGVALCRRLESVLAGGDPCALTERGPSLNFGLAAAKASEARYFADPPFGEDGWGRSL